MKLFIEDLESLILNMGETLEVCVNEVDRVLNKGELWDVIHEEKILTAEVLPMCAEDVYYIKTKSKEIVIAI